MKIREARIDDDAEAARLLGELGYPSTADEVRGRISRAITSKSTGVLLAERNKKVVGLAAFHYIPYFAVMGAFCRVTALVVGESERRTGSGERPHGSRRVSGRPLWLRPYRDHEWQAL